MDADLKQYLEAMEGRLNEHVDTKIRALESGLEGRLVELEHGLEGRLVEKMHDMQTELIRGFAAFSEGQTIRLRKVEVDQSNLDAAPSGRVNVVEGRLRQIELRQGIEPPQPPEARR
jgi:hypothetical protein